MTKIEIPISKTKLVLMLLGSIIFVALGIWMVIFPDGFTSMYRRYPKEVVFFMGLASIAFFGLCLILIVKKLTGKSVGLIIDDQAINDNSSGSAVGLIYWNDIQELRINKVANQKFITLIVNNPEQYINRQTSKLKKMALIGNYKYYGSPITISANGLKINFENLHKIIENGLKNYL